MSSNDVDSSFIIQTKYEEPKDYLTEREREIIQKTNKLANEATDQKVIDFFNLSLRDILSNWSNNMQAILMDLTDELQIDDTIKKSDNIYQFLETISLKLWKIFTKDFRIIYFGITLIFFSIVIYFVSISS